MRRARWVAITAAVIGAGAVAALWWPSASEAVDGSSEALARVAVEHGNPTRRERAIATLRARGAEGHAALMRVHASAIERLSTAPRRDAEAQRLRAAVDRVSGQRDGHASGLYWHTDLEAAVAEAERTDRPILSLRLLGRLDEELSCANSRYFRIVLYSNPEVARRLRERYVLHWSSERPAPRLTIDMGDGRRIVRTITGNSVHYVLDSRGRPMDAIVGLYSPDGFLAALDEAEPIAERCGSATDAAVAGCRARQHTLASVAQRQRWEALRQRDPSLPLFDAAAASLPGAPSATAPSARVAMPLTLGKAAIETPVLAMIDRVPTPAPTESVDWHRVGVLTSGASPLAARTRALLRLKTGRDDVDATARRLAEVALADGARNEVLFRRRIHEWFAASAEQTRSLEALNARVYAELLLTPADDPWLGLRADDLYDGVELGGVGL